MGMMGIQMLPAAALGNNGGGGGSSGGGGGGGGGGGSDLDGGDGGGSGKGRGRRRSVMAGRKRGIGEARMDSGEDGDTDLRQLFEGTDGMHPFALLGKLGSAVGGSGGGGGGGNSGGGGGSHHGMAAIPAPPHVVMLRAGGLVDDAVELSAEGGGAWQPSAPPILKVRSRPASAAALAVRAEPRRSNAFVAGSAAAAAAASASAAVAASSAAAAAADPMAADVEVEEGGGSAHDLRAATPVATAASASASTAASVEALMSPEAGGRPRNKWGLRGVRFDGNKKTRPWEVRVRGGWGAITFITIIICVLFTSCLPRHARHVAGQDFNVWEGPQLGVL